MAQHPRPARPPHPKALLSILLGGLLLLPALVGEAAAAGIGVIDLKEVFDNYYKTKAADASLKERAGEFDKEKKTLVEQYQTLRQEYEQAVEDTNNQAISADEREKRKTTAESKLIALREMEQTIQQFDRQALTTLEEQERRIRNKLLDEIQIVVDAKAKAGNYSLVIDTAAETRNRTPVILFSDGQNDLTQEVLAELNAAAPPEFSGDSGRRNR